MERLTERENQVLDCIESGMTSLQTANGLDISKRTVDFHLANIFDKLKVANRMQAVAKRREMQGAAE